MKFRFRAKNKNAEYQNGIIEAADKEEAIELLYQQGLVVVTIDKMIRSNIVQTENKSASTKKIGIWILVYSILYSNGILFVALFVFALGAGGSTVPLGPVVEVGIFLASIFCAIEICFLIGGGIGLLRSKVWGRKAAIAGLHCAYLFSSCFLFSTLILRGFGFSDRIFFTVAMGLIILPVPFMLKSLRRFGSIGREVKIPRILVWITIIFVLYDVTLYLMRDGSFNTGAVRHEEAVPQKTIIKRSPETIAVALRRIELLQLAGAKTEKTQKTPIPAKSSSEPGLKTETAPAETKTLEKPLASSVTTKLEELHDQATSYYLQGDYRQAESLFRELLAEKIGQGSDKDRSFTIALNDLALVCEELGKFEEVEELHKRALTIKEKVLGRRSAGVATTLNNLAGLYFTQGKREEALQLNEEVLAIREEVLDPDDPDIADSLNDLGLIYGSRGDHAKAEKFLKRALEILEGAYGLNHPDVATVLVNLAGVHLSQGKTDRVYALCKRSIGILKAEFGDSHPDVAQALFVLGRLYYEQGKYEEAEKYYNEALNGYQKNPQQFQDTIATLHNGLAMVYKDLERYAEAEKACKEALEIQKKLYGSDHPKIAATLNNLAIIYKKQGKYDEARELFEEALGVGGEIFAVGDRGNIERPCVR